MTQLFFVIKFLKYLQSFSYIKKKFNLIFNIDDFMNDILQQCNFRIEANNNRQFQDNFKDSQDFIIFPENLFIASVTFATASDLLDSFNIVFGL